MIIGTVRPEEARIHDSHAGYHEFHREETQEPFGSFEVYWYDPNQDCGPEDDPDPAGWYWVAGFPRCLWDGDPSGPFATSRQAREDADERAPEFDPSEDDGGA